MVRIFLTRIVGLALLWSVLTGGEKSSWLFGGPAILVIAAWRLGEAQTSSGRLRPWRLLLFVPFFLLRSFTGSCDVAWRALHWRLPIAPAVRNYAFRLPSGSPARVFFANSISLMPGTLTVAWHDDSLLVHLLSDTPDALVALRQLEDRVAAVFDHELLSSEKGSRL
ncbi:MAG: Na+/H+ antiporter subunit E [Pirellulaceae bacterium]|nr:Na+/H+ antiporter subunit E [Pirellulaceae bacterium]